LQKSLAKVHFFARTFATAGSEIMNIGYAPVSAPGQNLDLQLQALRKAGCKKIFGEKVSGVSRERTEFQPDALRICGACYDDVKGDTVLMLAELDVEAQAQ
jgi:hypothetical protein